MKWLKLAAILIELLFAVAKCSGQVRPARAWKPDERCAQFESKYGPVLLVRIHLKARRESHLYWFHGGPAWADWSPGAPHLQQRDGYYWSIVTATVSRDPTGEDLIGEGSVFATLEKPVEAVLICSPRKHLRGNRKAIEASIRRLQRLHGPVFNYTIEPYQWRTVR